jgi:DinB superfamily
LGRGPAASHDIVLAELELYQDQLLSIRQDAEGLIAGLTDSQFNWRPAPDRWSMAHCFDHLNVTARLFIPEVDRAMAEARSKGIRSNGPFVYSLFERLFLRFSEPPPKVRFRAPRSFRPSADKRLADVRQAFLECQDRLGVQLRDADGLDLQRARLRSPGFSPLRWSLGMTFAITLAHERRHIWQARQVRNDPKFPQ